MSEEGNYTVEGLHAEEAERKPSKTKGILITLGLLLVLVGGVCAVLVKDRMDGDQVQGVTELTDSTVVAELRKIMDVPADETPSIATVMDVTKLAGQPFFAKAKENDKLVLYTEAKKAILYRPSTNKIIEVMPLVLDAPAEANAVTSGTNQLNAGTN